MKKPHEAHLPRGLNEPARVNGIRNQVATAYMVAKAAATQEPVQKVAIPAKNGIARVAIAMPAPTIAKPEKTIDAFKIFSNKRKPQDTDLPMGDMCPEGG